MKNQQEKTGCYNRVIYPFHNSAFGWKFKDNIFGLPQDS
jgi:hypothetical protein